MKRTRALPGPPSASSLAGSLADWFPAVARTLPWRTNLADPARPRDAWASLVAEVMLQQTQVSRVVEYYGRFMARWPSPAALATADERDVLAAWAGLGYYRRARNLVAAARAIVERFNGRIPGDVESLRSLPGVGRYTAGAVASIALGQRAPIVDGNVARVLLRLHGRRAGAADPRTVRWAWRRAGELAAAARQPGVVNEAIMELGALVCTPPPGEPLCDKCPLAGVCVARARGIASGIPLPAQRAARPTIRMVCLIVVDGRGRVLLQQRPAGGLWAGLWQPPTLETAKVGEAEIEEWARRYCAGPVRRVGGVEANLTHRRVVASVFAGSAARCARKAGSQRWERVEALLGDAPTAGVSSFHKRVLRMAVPV